MKKIIIGGVGVGTVPVALVHMDDEAVCRPGFFWEGRGAVQNFIAENQKP
jgi:hypothetical protein